MFERQHTRFSMITYVAVLKNHWCKKKRHMIIFKQTVRFQKKNASLLDEVGDPDHYNFKTKNELYAA